jgi:hypothetical protein
MIWATEALQAVKGSMHGGALQMRAAASTTSGGVHDNRNR